MKKVKELTLDKIYPYLLVVGGIIGGFSAGVLLVEKIHLLQNPGVQLGCDLNPIIACGSVINTPQASAFGFPNPILGLIGFGALVAIGLGLLAGGKYKRWFWLLMQAGAIFGICFVTWLQFQSIYRIGALCPYCMVVWSVAIPIFWYTTVYNLRNKHIILKKPYNRINDFIQKHHVDILVAWYVIIIGAILEHFWYYWKTLI